MIRLIFYLFFLNNKAELVYDSDKIYSFPGFNEAPESGILDESDIYRVKRYGPEFSKEKFLSTLKLENKVRMFFCFSNIHSNLLTLNY